MIILSLTASTILNSMVYQHFKKCAIQNSIRKEKLSFFNMMKVFSRKVD